MLKNYNFDNIEEPARKKIAIEALRLELCDVLYHLRRASHSAFGSNYMEAMLQCDYGLVGSEYPNELYLEIDEMIKKVTKILLGTSDCEDGCEGKEGSITLD